jgi:exopolyphosphatase/guanosine-5'-triphosphate,3'-diphosphate pyrophosphatase
MFDSLRETEAKPGGAKLRELLWAAAMLHDVGKAIDYDDHHRHSKYLILGAGLPGYTQRELALIALMARYHRKGNPDPNGLAGLLEPGDLERLRRCSALLRLAEFLERGRDGAVESAALVPNGKGIKLELSVRGNSALAVWGAERQADAFADAFGRDLIVRP